LKPLLIEGTVKSEEVAILVKIIPFKTRQQLKTEKAVKVMREWEAHFEWEVENWHHVKKKREKKSV
jgi:hypothetical protein